MSTVKSKKVSLFAFSLVFLTTFSQAAVIAKDSSVKSKVSSAQDEDAVKAVSAVSRKTLPLATLKL